MAKLSQTTDELNVVRDENKRLHDELGLSLGKISRSKRVQSRLWLLHEKRRSQKLLLLRSRREAVSAKSSRDWRRAF